MDEEGGCGDQPGLQAWEQGGEGLLPEVPLDGLGKCREAGGGLRLLRLPSPQPPGFLCKVEAPVHFSFPPSALHAHSDLRQESQGLGRQRGRWALLTLENPHGILGTVKCLQPPLPGPGNAVTRMGVCPGGLACTGSTGAL